MPSLPLDPVTVYLKRQGYTPEIAYFENSGFVMGWRVRFCDFEWVYRVEDGILTVCDFMTVDDNQGKGASLAVAKFISLTQRIGREVQRLDLVRGRFIECLANSQINHNRERLANVLLAKGAQWQTVDGEVWLVYSLRPVNPL
jgi:hypothetical protein